MMNVQRRKDSEPHTPEILLCVPPKPARINHICAQLPGHALIRTCHRLPHTYVHTVTTAATNAELMRAYIDCRYDLHHVARLTGVPITDLLDWLADPHTRHTIEQIRAATEQSLAIRILEARRTALDALEEVLSATDDLIEKRRAATTLIRALNARTTGRHSDAASPSNARCPMPSAAAADCRVPSASPPDLESMLTTLADALTRDRADAEQADNALAALHQACTEDATINDAPIPADVDDFVEDTDLRPIARVDVATPTLADHAAATRLTCVHHDDTTTEIAIALVDENGWQIVAVVIDDTS